MKRISILSLSVLISFLFLSAGANGQMRGGRVVDREFIDMMMEHHRDGIEMARMAESKGRLPELRAFAAKSIAEQQSSLDMLQRMRDEMFPRAPMSNGMTVEGRRMTMAEMKRMSRTDMRMLENARSGRAFDRMFLDILTRHHQLAINMSRSQISNGASASLKDFSRQTIRTQNAGIREMARIRRRA